MNDVGPQEANSNRIDTSSRVLAAAKTGGSVRDCIPVKVEATRENALLL